MKDSVIIVSGGMDSITLLYDKKDEIALGISFDYGSNHNAKEIPLLRCIASDWESNTLQSILISCISISRVHCFKGLKPFPKATMPTRT